MDGGWRKPEDQPLGRDDQLLKLHGSLNWLVGYVTHDFRSGERSILIPKIDDGYETVATRVKGKWEGDDGSFSIGGEIHRVRATSVPLATCNPRYRIPHCFLNSDGPFATYDNRYRSGYQPFTYFFPPNIEDGEVYAAPMIVAPVQEKPYDEFSEVLEPLWTRAEAAIAEAETVTVVGYSFPTTDTRIAALFQHSRLRDQQIEIVDPDGERVISRFKALTGADDVQVNTIATDLAEYLQVSA